MVAIVDALGTLLIIISNAAITAVLTRFFRLRLATGWGSALYAMAVIPIVLLLVVFLASGVLGLGGAMDRATAVILTILLPLGVGGAIDVFWMPPPEAIENTRSRE